MKAVVILLAAALLIGCQSQDDLRKMMREEITRASAKTFYPSADVIGPYSPAVQVGPFLFVSGQIGLNPQTGAFDGDDIESQTHQALTNLTAALARAGFDSSDVVQCSVFLKDMKDFQKMNLIYGGFFAEGHYPTRTTVEVSNLPKNARVEISAVAYKSK
ncbi:MAG TPA: Rid family detoxifying hydrolase [Bacteroidota bacterium]|nr:Rid family detoxifying hydrolase [Bacteroidota bacterium]